MTLPNPHNPPQPAQEPPRWPMLPRRQEQLLQRIHFLQNLKPNGWCFESHANTGEALGIGARQVRRLVAQLDAAGYLVIKRRGRHETLLVRVRPPRNSDSVRVGHSRPTPGRTFVSGGVGHSCPPSKNSNTPNGGMGGHPPAPAPQPTPADPCPPAPLFDPPKRVNLWAEWARLKRSRPALTLPELLKDLVDERMVSKVRREGRIYTLVGVDVPRLNGQLVYLQYPSADGVTLDALRVNPDDLLKLEFYP